MTLTSPSDFVPIKEWHREHGIPVFRNIKMMHYYLQPIARELILAGAMAKVGTLLFLHKDRFWPEYQRIVSEQVVGK